MGGFKPLNNEKSEAPAGLELETYRFTASASYLFNHGLSHLRLNVLHYNMIYEDSTRFFSLLEERKTTVLLVAEVVVGACGLPNCSLHG